MLFAMASEWERASLVRRASQAAYLPLLRALWRFEVVGRENLPETGPLLVAGNHAALIDGPLMAIAAAPRRCVIGLAKQEIYSIPLLGWYMRRVGTIPLDRRGDVQAMRAALEHLEKGGCLGLFPEGTRSKTGQPGRAKAGLGFLAAKSRAQVVPVRLIGNFEFPWRPLKVVFGTPVPPPPIDADRSACLAFSDEILSRVFRL